MCTKKEGEDGDGGGAGGLGEKGGGGVQLVEVQTRFASLQPAPQHAPTSNAEHSRKPFATHCDAAS